MTAYELADRLDKYASFNSAPLLFTKAATMLRLQEAELTEAGGMIGVLREYISDLENGLDSSIKLNKAQAERQVKELTDEEILSCWDGVDPPEECWITDEHRIMFARAILRKAQEK